MPAFFQRSVVRAVFIVTCTALYACGGPARPPESPTTAVAEPPRSGSTAPDPAGAPVDKEALPPAPTTATSSTDNGSDIIPPFSSAKKNEKTDKTEKSGKGAAKKSGGKPVRRSSRKSAAQS